MSDVSCAVLPDLGEGAENGAANEHCGPCQGSGSSEGGAELLEQSPLAMKPFVLGKRMSPCEIRNNGHAEFQTWGEWTLRQRPM